MFEETKWTKDSKNLGEYIFRRISLDQSSEKAKTNAKHIASGLFIGPREINLYIEDYLKMIDSRNNNSHIEIRKRKLKSIKQTQIG